MDKDKLSKYRSEVIEKFINIEWIINIIISQYYLKRADKSFLFEVLYDEYFSFALKRRLLEKIIKNIANRDNRKIQDLNRLNTIRNSSHIAAKNILKVQIKHKKERCLTPEISKKRLILKAYTLNL